MTHNKFLLYLNPNHATRLTILICGLVGLLVAACGSTGGSINGTLRPWGEGHPIAERQMVLCKVEGEIQELPTDCSLMKEFVTSDNEGKFQFDSVQSGTYYIVHDSGLGDFASTLDIWKGKTLNLADRDWVLNEYCGYVEGDDINLHLLEGMSLMQPELVALVQALYVCNSPLLLALDANASGNRPLVVEVSNGQSVEIDLNVGYLSNDED